MVRNRAPCSDPRTLPRELLINHLSTLHHEGDMLQLSDVLDWISRYGDDICEFALFYRTDLILPAQHLSGSCCCRFDRLHRGHAVLHHVFELNALGAVRVNPSWNVVNSASEGDFYSF